MKGLQAPLPDDGSEETGTQCPNLPESLRYWVRVLEPHTGDSGYDCPSERGSSSLTPSLSPLLGRMDNEQIKKDYGTVG